MSSQPPWVYRGAFIPFFRPVPAITTDPLSATDTSLCWNDEWSPAILAALKVLCRPESWTGSEADIQTAMFNAQGLLAALTDGCSGTGIPFACPGDLSSSAAPYGVFSSDCDGTAYISGTGYRPTICAAGGFTYQQIAQIITFSTILTLTSVHIGFDYTKGHFTDAAGNFEIYITDVSHGTVLAHITQTDLVDGSGQALNWSGSIAHVGAIEVVITTDRYNDGTPLPVGDATWYEVDITGVAETVGGSPCG
jgi:hypothetical protein